MSDVAVRGQPGVEAVKLPLIELVGVEKVYRTGDVEFPALGGVDLTIHDGDMVAIVGPSGSGKSTIMNMITGIRSSHGGDRDGRRAAGRREDFARRVPKRERPSMARHNLELVGPADMADRPPSELSGGQEQRVAIARALASCPILVSGLTAVFLRFTTVQLCYGGL